MEIRGADLVAEGADVGELSGIGRNLAGKIETLACTAGLSLKFGAPHEITLLELAIESFCSADAARQHRGRRSPAGPARLHRRRALQPADLLRRLTSRIEKVDASTPETTTTWSYDDLAVGGPKALGKLTRVVVAAARPARRRARGRTASGCASGTITTLTGSSPR